MGAWGGRLMIGVLFVMWGGGGSLGWFMMIFVELRLSKTL